jgi:hypothetical protein
LSETANRESAPAAAVETVDTAPIVQRPISLKLHRSSQGPRVGAVEGELTDDHLVAVLAT